MSIDRGMDKEYVVHIYNGIRLSHKKNEIMPFAATWVYLEIIIISEVSQKKTNTIWYHSYGESNVWYKCTYLQKRNRLTDLEKKLMVTKMKGGRMGKLGLWRLHTYTNVC